MKKKTQTLYQHGRWAIRQDGQAISLLKDAKQYLFFIAYENGDKEKMLLLWSCIGIHRMTKYYLNLYYDGKMTLMDYDAMPNKIRIPRHVFKKLLYFYKIRRML